MRAEAKRTKDAKEAAECAAADATAAVEVARKLRSAMVDPIAKLLKVYIDVTDADVGVPPAVSATASTLQWTKKQAEQHIPSRSKLTANDFNKMASKTKVGSRCLYDADEVVAVVMKKFNGGIYALKSLETGVATVDPAVVRILYDRVETALAKHPAELAAELRAEAAESIILVYSDELNAQKTKLQSLQSDVCITENTILASQKSFDRVAGLLELEPPTTAAVAYPTPPTSSDRGGVTSAAGANNARTGGTAGRGSKRQADGLDGKGRPRPKVLKAVA
jgi:hypothetical protein